MRIIQDILEKTIENQFTFERMGARIIEHRLEQLGIKLTKEQKKKLRAKLSRGEIDNLALEIDDSQVPKDILSKQTEDFPKVSLDIGDAETFIERSLTQVSEAIPDMALKLGEILARNMHRKVKGMLTNRRSNAKYFESFIMKKWGSALDFLETLIIIASEAGEEFYEEIQCKNTKGKDHLIDAMTRLHARACQVAKEVLALLKAGYADGAHARWRCLHEINVVLLFLSSSGEEMAVRYLLHEAIESYKAALLHQKYYEQLGCEPFTKQEMDRFKTDRDRLVDRFGKSFAEDYGWAATEIGVDKPSFWDIENKVELSHIRPFYKMASYNVHANPKGVFFKLGVLTDGPDVLLAGPSALGFAEPGQGTAKSILQATTTLLTTEPNMDCLVTCDVLRRFTTKTIEAFIAAHQCIEEEIANNKDNKTGTQQNEQKGDILL
jgi:hypothetical protein